MVLLISKRINPLSASLTKWANTLVWLFDHFVGSDVFRPFWRPVYRFWRQDSGAQKTLFKFSFFNSISTKKYVEVAINDFTIHRIISKWLRIQKCRQREKSMKQIGQSERRRCQRKCFHLFNYVIDHASIRFFFYINSLHCFM